MFIKITLLCITTIFFKTINSQCIGNPLNGIGTPFTTESLILGNPGLPLVTPFAGLPCAPIIPETPMTYGHSIVENFPVTSASRIPPGTLSIFSDNLIIEGPIVVTGQLPFLASVAVQGELPAVGRGAVSYGCGNGEVGITNEGAVPAGLPYGYGNGYGYPAEIGYGTSLAGMGPNYRNYIA